MNQQGKKLYTLYDKTNDMFFLGWENFNWTGLEHLIPPKKVGSFLLSPNREKMNQLCYFVKRSTGLNLKVVRFL